MGGWGPENVWPWGVRERLSEWVLRLQVQVQDLRMWAAFGITKVRQCGDPPSDTRFKPWQDPGDVATTLLVMLFRSLERALAHTKASRHAAIRKRW